MWLLVLILLALLLFGGGAYVLTSNLLLVVIVVIVLIAVFGYGGRGRWGSGGGVEAPGDRTAGEGPLVDSPAAVPS